MSEVNRILAGRYLLQRLIGQGGMADVYLGEDTILKRIVAVKILRSSLTGDPIYITRFHREASAAAALSHPNIVAIYDVGDEDDLYYIIMEYIRGQTLKSLIHKRGALHYVEAIDIMKQVASGVAHAHSNGIVHRDLKPQNILVTDSGTVKIADFGIASIQSLSQVTQTDTIMGSLHYLAPEIARGEKATPQSDIYALGIVFYELLRGEVPFNGESPVNIALKHMRDEIPSVRSFNPSIPQSVENIIIKATAKNIKDRYHDANEMLQDLMTCLTRENESKIVFDIIDDDPTIVAGETQFFKKEEIEEKKVPVEKEPLENRTSRVTRIDQKQKRSLNIPKKKIAIAVSVILAVCLLIGVIVFINNSSQTAKIPDVTGLKKSEAISLLKEKGYKIDKTEDSELSDKYEKNYVIQTTPKVGTIVAKNSLIRLTVSSGKYIVMEDYTGKKYNNVKAKLEALGFKVKKYEKSDEEYASGIVIDQSISAGEKQDPNTKNKTITLTVSKGITITVPYLYGENIESAKKTLKNLGFNPTAEVLSPPTDKNEASKITINTVVKMSLDPYTQVHEKNKKIIIYYEDRKPETDNDNSNNGGTNTDGNTNNQGRSNNNGGTGH